MLFAALFFVVLLYLQGVHCQEPDQTPEHVLLDCPLWRTQRDLAWPEGATLAKQLRGSADELKDVLV
jgi:hypothetical protein